MWASTFCLRLDCHWSGVMHNHTFIFTATSCKTSFITLAQRLMSNSTAVQIVPSKVEHCTLTQCHECITLTPSIWRLRSQHSFPESYWNLLLIGPNTQLELKPNAFVGNTVLPSSSLSPTPLSHSALLVLPQHKSPEASLKLWQVTEVFCQLSSNRWEVIETTGN